MNPIALVALFIAGAAANYGSSGYAASAPAAGYGSVRSAIPITRFNHEIRGSESSSLDFETGNGIRQTESTQVVHGRGGSYEGENGQMVSSGASLSKSGSVAYTSPEGQAVHLSWVADENGFRATGDHLPTPPPIPAEIAASLRSHSYGGSSYAAPAAPAYSAPSYAAHSAPAYSAPAAPVQVSYGSSVRSGGY